MFSWWEGEEVLTLRAREESVFKRERLSIFFENTSYRTSPHFKMAWHCVLVCIEKRLSSLKMALGLLNMYREAKKRVFSREATLLTNLMESVRSSVFYRKSYRL